MIGRLTTWPINWLHIAYLVTYIIRQLCSVHEEKIIDATFGRSEYRFITIVDLHKFVNIFKVEISHICNSNY